MQPILLSFGDIVVASWHVFFVVGAMVGWYAMHSLREIALPGSKERQLDWLFVALYLAGYFGARLFSLIFEDGVTHPQALMQGLFRFGSMTLYGGIIAVSLVLSIFALWHKISLLQLSILFVAPGLIAIGIGRVGCFLNGDDYGAPVAHQHQLHPSWWAVRMPNLDDGLYRYPAQIWEAAFGMGCGALLLYLTRRYPEHRLMWVDSGVVSYTVARFFLEFYRGDERGQFFGTMFSTSQGVSLLLLGTWILYRLASGPRKLVGR